MSDISMTRHWSGFRRGSDWRAGLAGLAGLAGGGLEGATGRAGSGAVDGGGRACVREAFEAGRKGFGGVEVGRQGTRGDVSPRVGHARCKY